MKAVVLMVLVALLAQCEAMSCICLFRHLPIEERDCPPPTGCKGGQVIDACLCCMTCAKLLGERCGGDFKQDGTCDQGLFCNTTKDTPQIQRWSRTEGICGLGPTTIRTSTESDPGGGSNSYHSTVSSSLHTTSHSFRRFSRPGRRNRLTFPPNDYETTTTTTTGTATGDASALDSSRHTTSHSNRRFRRPGGRRQRFHPSDYETTTTTAATGKSSVLDSGLTTTSHSNRRSRRPGGNRRKFHPPVYETTTTTTEGVSTLDSGLQTSSHSNKLSRRPGLNRRRFQSSTRETTTTTTTATNSGTSAQPYQWTRHVMEE